MICDIPLQSPFNHHLETRLQPRKDGPHILCPTQELNPFISTPTTFPTTHTAYCKMVQTFSITHTTNQQQRPRSNAILNDNNNDNMKYDPTRKATEREEHPVVKIDVGQVSSSHH